jgi:hypothetical protein
MVFELATGDFLFEPKAGRDYSRDEDHMAQANQYFVVTSWAHFADPRFAVPLAHLPCAALPMPAGLPTAQPA